MELLLLEPKKLEVPLVKEEELEAVLEAVLELVLEAVLLPE